MNSPSSKNCDLYLFPMATSLFEILTLPDFYNTLHMLFLPTLYHVKCWCSSKFHLQLFLFLNLIYNDTLCHSSVLVITDTLITPNLYLQLLTPILYSIFDHFNGKRTQTSKTTHPNYGIVPNPSTLLLCPTTRPFKSLVSEAYVRAVQKVM